MKRLVIQSLKTIDETAKEFIGLLGENKIIAFYGQMGAGKTTFIKSVVRALGSNDNVTSPTFALVNEYKTELDSTSIFHFDFYRIEKLEEIFDFGYEDYFYSDQLCLIEWPELIEEVLPENTIKVQITELKDGSREIQVN